MKKLLLALALLLIPASASAQCSGVFAANAVCGTLTSGVPHQIPFTSFPTVSPIIYASNYGVVCNSSTDNTTPLNNAIAAVPATSPYGGTIQLPSGTGECRFSGTLNLNARVAVTIQGVAGTTGGATTQTRLAYTGTGTRAIDARDSYGVILKDLQVAYNTAGFTGFLIDAGGVTVGSSVSTSFTLRNVTLTANITPTATLLNVDQAILTVLDQVNFYSGAPAIRGAQLTATSTVLSAKNALFVGHVGPAITGCGEAWTFDTATFEADSLGRANAFSNNGGQACKGLVFINPWMGDVTLNGGTWITFKGSGLYIQGGRITANGASNEAISILAASSGISIDGTTFESLSAIFDFNSNATVGGRGNAITWSSSVTNFSVNAGSIVGFNFNNNNPSAALATAGQISIGQTSADPVAKTISGDVTVAASGAFTLATVNANVGTFGSATQCVTFTTNGKGLITAASAATCTPALASITGMGTGVATALAVNIGTAGSFVVNGGVLGTPSSGTGTNLTGIPTTALTGALQAAQEPAHTGDMTNSAGSLATTVVGINGVLQTTAWTTYTPTITCGAGTITTLGTVTGGYKVIGKSVLYRVAIPITTVGTCTSFVQFSLPPGVTSNATQGTAGKDTVSGKMISAGFGAGGTIGFILLYDGTTAAASGANLTIAGVLEQQ